MKTYQDWLEVADKSEQERMTFIYSAINDHKASKEYQNAVIGEEYYNAQNTTIRKYEKVLYNARGQAMPDYVSANHKIASRFFYRDVTQMNSVLLGNGITWKNGEGGKALGDSFDRDIMDAGRGALTQGTSFGFYNNGKVDIFYLTDFKPFLDEEDGALKAGIRFWQLADNKPLRATLYELDGYTEYRFETGKQEVLQEKRPYIIEKRVSEADGEEIEAYMNYPTFPIVPFYANSKRESELLFIRPKIDAYDLISSGYCNDVSDASIIYWILTNADGMTDGDLVQTLDKLRKMHAAQLAEDQALTPNKIDAPYESREAVLDRLEKELYKDAMAFNPYDIASGAITATQIEAAYDPLDEKLDLFERHVSEFITGLLAVAGVDDEPTYKRSYHTNKSEYINTILNSAMYLDDDYITETILTTLGDKDKVADVLAKKAEASLNRLSNGNADTQTI